MSICLSRSISRCVCFHVTTGPLGFVLPTWHPLLGLPSSLNDSFTSSSLGRGLGLLGSGLEQKRTLTFLLSHLELLRVHLQELLLLFQLLLCLEQG